jgi:peroxiredoxin Q/BCP
MWKSVDQVGTRIVVLYFYPGDFTGGCTRQAQSYRDAIARLEELGIELVGISGDDVATHKLFKESHGLTHTLLADPDGALAAKLGIPVQRHNRPMKVRTRDSDGKPLLDQQGKSIIIERKVTLPRWTLIIARDGTLVSKRTNVDPAKDAEEVAKTVESLKP